MQRCGACGATLMAGAAWCGQCFSRADGSVARVATAERSVMDPVPTAGRVGAAPAAEPLAAAGTTRWGKTPTTFGPTGRVLSTLALVVPLALMVVGGLADPFVWGGAGLWAVVVLPWGLRDVWKAGRRS